MYRTSSNDMGLKKEAIGVKGRAIPGYSGFVPGKMEKHTIGQTFTRATRTCFRKEEDLSKTRVFFKSAGIRDSEHFDKTRPAYTCKYGQRTMAPPHPSNGEPISKTAAELIDPRKHQKPTSFSGFKVAEQEFDEKMTLNKRKNHKNYSSGFQNCNQLFDGTGWHTE